MKLFGKLTALLSTGLLLATLTTGCSTMEGLGKDIQKAGQSIEKEAKKN